MELKKSAYRARHNKKGILEGTVIFVLLNILFFSLLLYFVLNSASGAGVQQKILAKQIALFINSAEPGTRIGIDIEEYKKLAEKNSIKDFIIVTEKDVSARLSNTADRYTYPHFSKNKIDVKYGEGFGNFLWIEVRE